MDCSKSYRFYMLQGAVPQVINTYNETLHIHHLIITGDIC